MPTNSTLKMDTLGEGGGGLGGGTSWLRIMFNEYIRKQ